MTFPSRRRATATARGTLVVGLVNDWVGDRDTPFQMGLLAVFDPGPFARDDGSVDLPRVAHEFADRAAGIPTLRRRVIWTLPGEGRPAWVVDPSDDPVGHVAAARVPEGVDLATWAANRSVVPLDRDRTMWRADVLDGLPGGRFAVLLVVHHVLVDGLAGMRLLATLLDPSPDATREEGPRPGPQPPPSHRELVLDRLSAMGRPPRDGPDRARPARPGPRRAVAQYRSAMADFAAPIARTSLPRHVGPTRRMTVVTAVLEPLRSAGHRHGATVNDLVLAAVARGLRELLTARGECHESLSVRTILPVATDGSGQATAMMVVDLPVGSADPARRLAAVVQQTTARKARLRAAGPTRPNEALTLPLPVARVVIPWARRRGSAKIHLSVTNVPGPRTTLWFKGARMVDAVPVPPLVPLVGLTVAALSYDGRLCVAVNADGGVDDLGLLAAGIAASFADLGADVARGILD
ncbi:MAG TPA: wax ester/triacylglycerol synthase domain-containing protein [Phycicoccus sp.]|nr:wax ester/triacylglycerol synthase domain-containing protein [Phycicoccus sp.]